MILELNYKKNNITKKMYSTKIKRNFLYFIVILNVLIKLTEIYTCNC